ncbi:tyrosine-type recombinase/integrase [Clostridium pasteurianum]|uniref:tyrosine-type recombinase/integrase n=1 Tax=Clostridium pasteurianum TaxID=1501 RepID=UPI0009B8F65F|nr:tyrosine-type recombinase/integrase [Clostridium pasteurianum]UZW16359.1 tyrosine-type recombinase/integrase [Clostridium pasteurianum]
MTFHQLKHTYATLLISSGQEIKSVSKRLGHSNTTTTLNIYTHTDRSSDKKAAEEMEKILFKNDEK